MSTNYADEIAKQLPPKLRLVIEYLPVPELIHGTRQLKILKKHDLDLVVANIRHFGFLNPVIIDENNRIICGKSRVKAARLLGMTELPCIRLAHLTDAELRVFAIAENQLGQLAGLDQQAMSIELSELKGMNLSFSLELTGFSSAKIDSIIFGGESGDRSENAIPAVPEQIVSRLGDLWQLGDSRLLCADATAPASFDQLLAGEKVRVVFTDPPYNVGISGHVTSGGKHGEFVMASGEMTDDEFTAFSTKVMLRARENLIDGGLLY